jgi:hypothetical protein
VCQALYEQSTTIIKPHVRTQEYVFVELGYEVSENQEAAPWSGAASESPNNSEITVP